MQTIAFIREHGLAALETKFHIAIKRHPKFPNLVMLKYNQIESPMGEPIVQECRGLILDEADDWRVISYPYRKFFNHGEGHAANIDWSTAQVYEKLDGSLVTLFQYSNNWHVASSGLPDAGGMVYEQHFTFAELFWKVWDQLGYVLPPLNIGRVFMFELMTPYNRIVVPQKENRLVLHGARRLRDLREESPATVAEIMGWDCVKSHSLITDIDRCVRDATAMDPMQSEGYVVCDGQYNRIKVKSPQYVALSHMKESTGPRAMLEIIRANESQEFLSYFPELRERYESLKLQFDALVKHLEAAYEAIGAIDSQKNFALCAMQTRWSAPLFGLRAGKCESIRSFIAKASMEALQRAIENNPACVSAAA